MGRFDELAGPPPAPSPEELSRFALNDDGNAMRFIRMAGGLITDEGDVDLTHARVLFLRHRGWIVFNGTHWDLEVGESLARRHAIKVARAMHEQIPIKLEALAEARKDPLSGKAVQGMWDFATGAGNNGRISSMMAVAASYMDVPIEAFDRDPMALNCRNGVVRFERKPEGPVATFTPGHNPADRFTRITNADYHPEAPAALFASVLKTSLPRVEDRSYVHRMFGYSATGATSEQKFFVLQGKGGDGKSTIVNAVRHALGTYATTAAIETFLDTGVKRGSEASPDIAALAGDSRMICAGEPPSGSKLATGQIKQFTGGGKIKARELREGLFEFTPIGKPIIECNRRPAVNDSDNGIWRRLKIIPFGITVPADKVDGTLPAKLEAEAAGILAWVVAGTLAWMTDGLKDTASVAAALEDYRKGSNTFVQWFDDRMIREPDAREEAGLWYKDYKAWMEDQGGGDKAMSQKAFGQLLGEMQLFLGSKNAEGRVTRVGARLRTAADGPASRADEAQASAGGQFAGGDSEPDDDVIWPGEDGQP